MSISQLMQIAMKKESQRHLKKLADLEYEYELKVDAEYGNHMRILSDIEGGAEDAEVARKGK